MTKVGPMTFEEWLADVDRRYGNATGLSIRDMPDAPWADYFEDGLTPREAIQCAKEDWF